MAEDKKERFSRMGGKLSEYKDSPAFKRADWLKLIIAIVLASCGVWLFYNMLHLSIYIRLIFPVVGLLLGLLVVFFWCDFGKRLIAYVRESVTEFKKVVWPPKRDATRMTVFVVIFVAILSLFIYAVDSFISWLFFDLLLKRG